MTRGCVMAGAALWLTAHCATTNAKGSKMSDLQRAFEAADAAGRLGHAGGTIRSVSEYLPGVAWVIIDAPDGGEGRPVVVENGRFDPAHDAKLAARVLHRLVAATAKFDADRLVVLLEKFSALPAGFSSSQVGAVDPLSGEHGGLTPEDVQTGSGLHELEATA
jgi:hypothetical protein